MILNDKYLVYEMGWFERKHSSTVPVFCAVNGKNDDYMMAFIWAMYCINNIIAENYFIVEKTFQTKQQVEIPHIIKNFNNPYYDEQNFGGYIETNTVKSIDMDTGEQLGDSRLDKLYRQLKEQYENSPNGININNKEQEEFKHFGMDVGLDNDDGWVNI